MGSPFLALQEDLSWFLGCSELRVMHIATAGTERATVVEQTARAEGHPENRSPFFVLEDAHNESAWLLRAERMRLLHEGRRAAMAREGYQLEALTPLSRAGDPLACFASQVRQCLDAQAKIPELAGIVLVLAPTILEAPEQFAVDVIQLLRVPAFAHVRAIVIELGDASAEPLMHAFGELAMLASCKVDPEEQRREHAATLAAMAGAPAGASPEVQAGFAGPRDVIAPPRHGKPPRDAPPPPEVAEMLAREMGPLAALTGPAAGQLKQRIFGAAHAVTEGRFDEAIRLQMAARDQCVAAGAGRLACILEVALGAFLLQAGRPADSHAAFDASAGRAAAANMWDLSAQALLGLGAVLRLEGNLHGAAVCYQRAGEAAERASVPQLAIEAYRTAGQVALEARAEDTAVVSWRRALSIAQGSPAEIAATSSAPAAARALAKVCQERGSHVAAQSLIVQADAYERASASEPASPKSEPTSAHAS